jgi:hypothetical protein
MSEEREIKLKESELRELIDSNKSLAQRIAELEAKATDAVPERKKPVSVREREYTVRKVDGKIVIGFANHGTQNRPLFVYERPNPHDPTQRLQWVDLILAGEKEPVPVEYVQFFNESEKIKCKLVHLDKKPWAIEQGVTTMKEVNTDGYQVDTGIEVDVMIEGEDLIYTLALPEGGQITLPAKYVNM